MAGNPSNKEYDILVVGAGMIGSSAARHLLHQHPQLKVGLIGPQATEVVPGNTIHGAHYDEGRITRELGTDPVWSTLALRSIERYRATETLSGINFYNEVGFLVVGKKDGDYVLDVKKVVQENNIEPEITEGKPLKERFPYLEVTDDMEGIFTAQKSGHISPRLFVKAQRQIAMMLGCEIIDDVVKKVQQMDGYLDITTDTGAKMKARKVLVATGAFSHCRYLLPGNRLVDLDHRCSTTLLSEVAEKDVHRFSGMPSLYVANDSPVLQFRPEEPVTGFYILPPIKYPDGKWYLKIGNSRGQQMTIQSPEEIDAWYKKRISEDELKPYLCRARSSLFKDLKPAAEYFDQCVTCLTVSERPYIDMATPSIGVALGGCGWAAKSADEIGLVAARMIYKGSWDYDIPRENFKCHYKNQLSKL